MANDSPLHALDGLEQATFAFNDPDSQSGVHCLRPLLDIEPSLNRGVESGGHRFSIEAVADGRADFAAIDAFSFLLAERFIPHADSRRSRHRPNRAPSSARADHVSQL